MLNLSLIIPLDTNEMSCQVMTLIGTQGVTQEEDSEIEDGADSVMLGQGDSIHMLGIGLLDDLLA